MANVLFDVNGTLLDPRALTASWEGAPSGLGLSVLDQTVLQSMVDTMTGEFRPFADYIRAALAHRARAARPRRRRGRGGHGRGRRAARLPRRRRRARAPARRRPRAERGDEQRRRRRARRPSATAGLLEHMHAVVGPTRPAPTSPTRASTATRSTSSASTPAETWFVAGHWWDVTGAKRAGLRTAWVRATRASCSRPLPSRTSRPPTSRAAAEAIAAAYEALLAPDAANGFALKLPIGP